jgi:glucokinase
MKPWLLADIGGTWARFALLADGVTGPVEALSTGAHAEPLDAIRHFLGARGVAAPAGAMIAAAGPVEDGICRLTNAQWTIDGAQLARALGCPSVQVVNDLQALAWAVPDFAGDDLLTLGDEGHPRQGEPVALIAPGTGLGIACYVPGEPQARVLASEGGHASLAAEDADQQAVIDVLRRRHGHVSAERVLSGGGLEGVYSALRELSGLAAAPLPASEIVEAARSDAAPHAATARHAVDLFCAVLGSVAGNLALTFGARGGVLIGGGIAPRLAAELQRPSFRARFESKGRLGAYLRPIPTRLIRRKEPTFVGLRALAVQQDGTTGRRAAPP